ncbi:MAG: glutamyl-tRNA synthetase [Glaciecola sp.]|jgi:glutamyl-tRNA synthetase
MSDKRVRVRFAPSPTGPLHIGGVRTALYNYLFAKHHNGDFLLRIEDTDRTRFVEGAEEYIIESLKWLGIEPNEGQGYGGDKGPYKQSERMGTYRQYADQLIESGHAYYAFDTQEELTDIREKAAQAGVSSWKYNHITRNSMKNSLTLPEDEVKTRLENGDSYVIRIKLPREEDVRVEDAIRGWVVVNTKQMDDKVLVKNDGLPTYHLANIVDDHLMEITHVIRGEEWLPSAPLHVLLYRYLGWEAPVFAHLSLILKPTGKGKLSKRDGDKGGFPVFPLNYQAPGSEDVLSGYREAGYYPDAVVNILAFLGWNPGTTQEMFSLDELVKEFSLERVGKSGAKFDPDKAKWFNQQYLRNRSNEELAKEFSEVLHSHGVQHDSSSLETVVELLKERALFVEDMIEGRYLFDKPTEFDEKTVKKKWKENTPDIVRKMAEALYSVEPFKADKIEEAFKDYLTTNELGMGAVMPNLRLLLTGKGMGPSLFHIIEILGKEEMMTRIESGINELT